MQQASVVCFVFPIVQMSKIRFRDWLSQVNTFDNKMEIKISILWSWTFNSTELFSCMKLCILLGSRISTEIFLALLFH